MTMPNLGKGMEQLEVSLLLGEMLRFLWEIVWHFLIKLNMQLSYSISRYQSKRRENICPHKDL